MNTPSSQKRVLIACGGTGGHLAPGIAVAQRLTERGHSCQLLISAKVVDQRLSQKYPNLTFQSMPASVGITKNPATLFKFAWGQLSSLAACAKVMHQYKPNAVVGFGGFLTVSAGVCAASSGVPLYLHESNHKIGRTIKLLAGLAKKVYVPLGISHLGISQRNTQELAMPLRKDLEKVSREEARKALGIPQRGKLLVILGGSQGASALNTWAQEHESLLLDAGVHLYCQTGMGKVEPRATEQQLPLGQIAKSVFVPFSDQMHLLYAAADLVVARAGAGTIAELIAFGAPSILIPFPFAADDHQTANARNLERQGGAIVVEETQLETLFREVMYALKSETLLDAMKLNLQKIDQGDPAGTIVEAIESLKNKRPSLLAVGAPQEIKAVNVENLQAAFEESLRAQKIDLSTLKLTTNEPLASKTTFGIGGAASLYAEPATERELQAIHKAAQSCGIPVFYLGRGSNLLALDSGYKGLIIRLNHPNWQKIELLGDGRVKAGAGTRLKALCAETTKAGLIGFEFMEGIPATIGGALRMNAGAMGGWTFERIEKVRYMDKAGQIHEKPAKDFKASYRSVPALADCVVLSVLLKAADKGSPDAIRQVIEGYQAKRKSSQPREASAGCVFKNPEGTGAGKIIDELGLKGLRVGDACVSTVHANFIVNMGEATSADVIKLINQIRAKVWESKKIKLEVEIMLLGGEWNDYLLP